VNALSRTTSGLILATYASASDASRETDINQGNITSVCNNKRLSAGGFGWAYANKDTPLNVLTKAQLQDADGLADESGRGGGGRKRKCDK